MAKQVSNLEKSKQTGEERHMSNEGINSWDDAVVADLNPQFDVIPEGDYTFKLIGAAPHKFAEGALNVSVAIDSEGEQRGRRVFQKLKSPAENPGVLRDVARLAQVMGIDPQPGEKTMEYLGRAAQEGGRFAAPLTHYKYVNKETGEDGLSVQVRFGKARPAA
jgi:hypothetical protein